MAALAQSCWPAAEFFVLVEVGGPSGTSVSKGDLIEVAGTVGGEIVVTLQANPTTGYVWKIAEAGDQRIVSPVGHRFDRAQKHVSGTGGRDIWTFRGDTQGKTAIAMVYVRPWEKGVPPVRKIVLRISITP